jgi:hypothetical protein
MVLVTTSTLHRSIEECGRFREPQPFASNYHLDQAVSGQAVHPTDELCDNTGLKLSRQIFLLPLTANRRKSRKNFAAVQKTMDSFF